MEAPSYEVTSVDVGILLPYIILVDGDIDCPPLLYSALDEDKHHPEIPNLKTG